MQDEEPEVLGLGVLSQEGRQDLHLVQLESCVRQPDHPEVLGLGEVSLLGVLQEVLQQPENLELGLGAFQAVRKESHETRQKSFVSSAPVEGPSLSEKILLHCDTALLDLDFVKELAVDPEVNDPVKLVMDVDHCPEPSDLAGRLG